MSLGDMARYVRNLIAFQIEYTIANFAFQVTGIVHVLIFRVNVLIAGNGRSAESVPVYFTLAYQLIELAVEGRPGYEALFSLQVFRDLRRRQKTVFRRSKALNNGLCAFCVIVRWSFHGITTFDK